MVMERRLGKPVPRISCVDGKRDLDTLRLVTSVVLSGLLATLTPPVWMWPAVLFVKVSGWQ